VNPTSRARRLVALASLLSALLAFSPRAEARQSDEHSYTYDQLWRAAVRLIAVDFRFPIAERDPEIGYVLFQYVDQGRQHEGSFELVRTRAADGSERVRAVIQVSSMPGYVERMMLDRLRRKLMDDYGPPPSVRSAPRGGASPSPDGPSSDSSDSSDSSGERSPAPRVEGSPAPPASEPGQSSIPGQAPARPRTGGGTSSGEE
jgi:hypothetical protein